MNNITALYYILAGPVYYQVVHDRERLSLLKEAVRKETEYFFGKRYVMREPWHQRYMQMLTGVFSINLLARRNERRLFRSRCLLGGKYSKFAYATMLALKEYNANRKYFHIDVAPDFFLKGLIEEINERVNNYCEEKNRPLVTEFEVHSNTPMGVELEFSNKGKTAGKFFENGKHDALLNFSKYHYYHLMKFMWRFGAYVDAEMPFKQFIKKGGFLEYTFTRPDVVFKPSEPLTSSPAFAAKFVEEAIRFTPVRPHSLHITFQISEHSQLLPILSFKELLFMMMCTGHFLNGDKGMYESRITEGNMKDWAVMRDRRNKEGWVLTVEFTHMRACRDFVRRKVYEPSILLLLAYKNLFNFSNIEVYSRKLLAWAKKPAAPEIDLESFLAMVRKGLDMEVSLPEGYKDEALRQIGTLYQYNKNLLAGG